MSVALLGLKLVLTKDKLSILDYVRNSLLRNICVVAGLHQLPVVLLGFRACAAGAVCAHCRLSTLQIEPKKAMEEVSVKTLRGAAALPTNQPPPVLSLLSFKEHEVSVDRGRFGNIGKNENFHNKNWADQWEPLLSQIRQQLKNPVIEASPLETPRRQTGSIPECFKLCEFLFRSLVNMTLPPLHCFGRHDHFKHC